MAMKIISFAFALPLVFLLAVVGAQAQAQEQSQGQYNYQCSPQEFETGSDYSGALGNVLQFLGNNVCSNSFWYTVWGDAPNDAPIVFGYATCDSSLSQSDCTNCVTTAASDVLEHCPNAYAANFTIFPYNVGPDCKLRYDQYDFYDQYNF